MHELQKILLLRLKNKNGLRYSELTEGYDFEDNIVFHIRQLIKSDLVSKKENLYFITLEGLKHLTQFDLPSLKDSGFKTFFIGFFCVYENQYLIKEHRLEENTFYNLPSGKPHFGEPIEQALVRTFYEETNIILPSERFVYQTLHLKTVKTSNNEVIFDDAFAIYKVNVTSEDVQQMKFKKGAQFMTYEQIKTLRQKWPEIDLCINKKPWKPYSVYEFVSQYILD